MECLNMSNNKQQSLFNSSMDPRISFSNDFVETQHASLKLNSIYREAPVSSDFEFSVENNSMISADEIFFQGRLLPIKDECINLVTRMTLRDELLVEDDYEGVLPRLSRSSGRWKERFGFKRVGSNVSKRGNKSDVVLERVDEDKKSMFVQDDMFVFKKE